MWDVFVFDLGETLINFNLHEKWFKILKDVAIPKIYDFLSEENLQFREIDISKAEFTEIAYTALGKRNNPETFLERNKDLFQRLAIPLTQSTFSQICEIFYHTIREYPFIYPETQDVLSVLHQKYPRTIGLWSDTPFQSPGPIIHRFVEQFNIAKYFTHTFYSGDFGLRKPDPKTLELVQQKFNIEKSRMVYIGNSPKDIQTAVNFGIDGIWINRKLVKYPKEKGFPKPTFEISNLREIIDILNK